MGQIQEETHRFAVSYHHRKHTNNAYRSVLDEIPGVGAVRKKQLLKAFGTVKAIREAEFSALCNVVPRPVAQAIYDRFHAETDKEETKCE